MYTLHKKYDTILVFIRFGKAYWMIIWEVCIMSSFKYYVRGWRRDDAYFFTAREIYEQLMEDRKKSKYDWVIPPSEILEKCNYANFPIEIARKIKDILLAEIPEICK